MQQHNELDTDFLAGYYEGFNVVSTKINYPTELGNLVEG